MSESKQKSNRGPTLALKRVLGAARTLSQRLRRASGQLVDFL